MILSQFSSPIGLAALSSSEILKWYSFLQIPLATIAAILHLFYMRSIIQAFCSVGIGKKR